MRSEHSSGATPIAPGPVLRGTVAVAAVATLAVVVSAALGSEHGHWGAALVALPLLVAAVVVAKSSTRGS